MTYSPTQFGIAKAGIIGRTTENIGSAVINSIDNISKIVKQKKANEKVQEAYLKTLHSFVIEAQQANPTLKRGQAMIAGRKIYKRPVAEFDAETNLKNLVAADVAADNYLEKQKTEATQQQATDFTKSIDQPVEGSRQIRSEGPPIQEGERAGEVPTETEQFQRPMRSEEFQKGLGELPLDARKQVPEDLGARVASTEQTFQQPLKTFEDQRDKDTKARNENIKTMGVLDKGTGINTAIIESGSTVEGLNTKKKSLNELIKTVAKSNNLAPKQIESKGTEMQGEIEELASQLNIPAQLASNPEFLGRMQDDIDRLIQKEQQQQKTWDVELKDLRKRQEAESLRKRTPKPPAATPDWRLGKELQAGLKDMTKQQFPNLYKVIEGEYGVEVMKQTSGIAEAARAIIRDPRKRIALAYAFPDEVGAIAQAKGAQRPPEEEIQSVLAEMKGLQDKVYGVINSTSEASPVTDPKNRLGIRLD